MSGDVRTPALTTDCPMHENVALYSLGLLDAAGRAEVETHLSGCPACEAELRSLSEVVLGWAEELPQAAPPASVKSRLMGAVKMPANVSALVRMNEGAWEPAGSEGLERKFLYRNKATGEMALLLRVQPGAVYPSHSHARTEHLYVIDGDLAFDDHTLLSGDYEATEPGRDHASARSETGCLALVIYGPRAR